MDREDLFTLIHKALRALLYDLGLELQTNDFTDKIATLGLLPRIPHDLEVCTEHANAEEGFIFPDMRDLESELVAILESEHQDIESLGSVVVGIMGEVDALEDPDELITAGIRLNQAFNEYTAFFLRHLNYEEKTILPASQEYFSDEQLRAMRAAIMESQSPEQNIENTGWILRSANNNELAHTLMGMKASGMPPEILEGIMSFARDTVGEERFEDIKQKAGM
jgi:hemerythrin superfamily protein